VVAVDADEEKDVEVDVDVTRVVDATKVDAGVLDAALELVARPELFPVNIT
jgi:hypothetical protein